MHRVALFVEDQAHRAVLEALLARRKTQHGVSLHADWRNVRNGHGAVVNELKQFVRDLRRQRAGTPDLLIVATDANCKGTAARRKEITDITESAGIPTVCAIPDPHIERWLMLDAAAFKAALGVGCSAPDLKCERSRYKKQLIDAISACGVRPIIGGIEFAEPIIREMDLDRVAAADKSFGLFMQQLNAALTRFASAG